MRAIAVTPGEKNSARIINVSTPEIKPNEVLIEAIRVGIDGTDREINNAEYGTSPEGFDYLIIGHEALGRIVKLGDESLRDFQVDDFVVPLVRKPDDCHFCQSGQPDMCIKGNYREHGIKGEHGFLREYFPMEPEYLIKIPENLKEVAVLLEPLSIVEKAIRQAWKIQERMAWAPKHGLIIGLGQIGLLGSLIAQLKGLKITVYSMEEQESPRVKLIKSLGMNYISGKNIEIEELPAVIGENIDFILEATGNSIIAIRAMSLVGQNGILCLTGVTGGHKRIEICADCLNLDLVLGNKLIYGTVNANRIDFEKGVEHMQYLEKNHPGLLENVITDRFPLSNFKKSLNDFNGLKAVIEFKKME